MELMSFFKNNLRAVFILALIFTGLDPGGLKSQCIDLHSSPCYVNISDIPFDMLKNTAYSSRPKAFFDMIRKDSIYADTCNSNWIWGDRHLYFHAFFMFINKSIFNNYVNEGDSNVTKNDISSDYQSAKDIINQFESDFCNIKFIILGKFPKDGYTVEVRLEKHLQDTLNRLFWWKKDSNNIYFQFNGSTIVSDITDVKVRQYNNSNKYQFKQLDEDHILIYYTGLNNENNIDIYDILGLNRINTITSGYETTINTSNLSKGLYFIKIDNQIQKFIKE
jgi:hypothetical protein